MTVKIAKQWFRDNPRSTVVFHRRWDIIGAASRETLSAPREARVNGHRVIFDARSSGRSELSLVGLVAEVDAVAAEMELFDKNGEHFITYRRAGAGEP